MTGRRRLTVVAALVTGAGVVLPLAPARADDAPAALLEQSAAASEQLAYSGTKYVAAWRPTGTTSSLVQVRHDSAGVAVQLSPTAAPAEDDGVVLARSSLDGTLLRVLEDSYDLRLAGTGRCTGREADLVEARRRGTGTVAGRFWVDQETHLLLRREVYDDAGRSIRSSAYVDLQVAAPLSAATTSGSAAPVGSEPGDAVPPAELDRLRRAGWPLPDRLPGGFVLFDARSRAHGSGNDGRVLHLAYTDGLSTTSLFVQNGRLGGHPPSGFGVRTVGGKALWARDGAPERLVWSGDGHVLTLVSDAPDTSVAAAVVALPHAALPGTGLRARLSRGLHRLVSWVNPFD